MSDNSVCDGYTVLGGAIVYSHHGGSQETMDTYGDSIDCRITFRAEHDGWRLMLRIVDLDIPDTSYRELCNDALYIYDAKTYTVGQAVVSLL